MSTDTLELPPIIDPAAGTGGALTNAKPAAAPSLKATVLASFNAIEGHLTTLAARYRDVALDVSTPKGLAAAKAIRLELREDGRFAVQRLTKRLKDEANDLKRTVDEEGERLVAIVRPVEDAVHAVIEAEEQRKEAERAEKERKAAERREQIAKAVAMFTGAAEKARGADMTAIRIAAGIELVEGVLVDAVNWGADHAAVQGAKDQALTDMRQALQAAQDREAEAARLEALRAENERVAAQLAAQQQALAAQAAELKRQADELAAQKAAQEAAQAAELKARQDAEARDAAQPEGANVATAAPTTGKAETPGHDAPEAAPTAQLDQDTPAAAGAAPLTVHQLPEADAAPGVGTAGNEPEDGPIETTEADARPWHPPTSTGSPATMSLGDIERRLGFALTERFMTLDLELPPFGTQGRSRLWLTSQWPAIKAALIDYLKGID